MYHLYFNLIIYRKILSFVIFVFGLKSRVYYISEVKRKNTSSGYFTSNSIGGTIMKKKVYKKLRNQMLNSICAIAVPDEEDSKNEYSKVILSNGISITQNQLKKLVKRSRRVSSYFNWIGKWPIRDFVTEDGRCWVILGKGWGTRQILISVARPE